MLKMADGPGPAKKAKTDDLPECPYGAKCYRKNPQHFKEYSHTGKGPSTSDRDAVSKLVASPSSLPMCKYGAKCYRKNLMHFAEFWHPTTKAGDADKDGSSTGSDTDVLDSSDEEKEKKNGSSDLLSRGMSLVKSYSQMSEEQRKELIKKAFEAKKQLQEELDATKKKVEEKEKELDKLQAQVNTGLLLVEGEKEALEGTDTKIFTLAPERAYKEGSADQIHFRLAESQFYRLLSGSSSNFRIVKVEYIVNPELVKRFKQAKADLVKSRGESFSYPVLGFHGTQEKNISLICESGFKVPGESGFKMRTDTGWYGAGVYFSEYPAYSMGYISGATKLLLCQLLPGKTYQCTKLIHGSKLQKGYDSHVSPCKKELIVFNSHRILPSYVVHYAHTVGDFKYNDVASELELDKYKKSLLAPSSGVFANLKIMFSGKFCTKQADLNNLVKSHGADKATMTTFNLLVTTSDECEACTKKVQEAKRRKIHMVREEYLYDCILEKIMKPVSDYEVT